MSRFADQATTILYDTDPEHGDGDLNRKDGMFAILVFESIYSELILRQQFI